VLKMCYINIKHRLEVIRHNYVGQIVACDTNTTTYPEKGIRSQHKFCLSDRGLLKSYVW